MKPRDTFDPSGAFYVGQEVVCIKADFDPAQQTTHKSELIEGKVYRIRWLGIYSHYVDGDYLGIRVEGIVRGRCPIWGYEDPPFFASRFRPVVKDPLAVFRNMAASQDGGPFVPLRPEGPVRNLPDDGGTVKERELEEA